MAEPQTARCVCASGTARCRYPARAESPARSADDLPRAGISARIRPCAPDQFAQCIYRLPAPAGSSPQLFSDLPTLRKYRGAGFRRTGERGARSRERRPLPGRRCLDRNHRPLPELPVMKLSLLKLDNISVRLGDRLILDRVTLDQRRGEIVTVIGPNGAGKSTLIRAALGLIKPVNGTIARAPALRIGYMPQRLNIDPSLPLTVMRFMRLGGADRAGAMRALGEVGVSDLHGQPLQRISGGELQR